jgi:Protein of unknown function (DUF4239)
MEFLLNLWPPVSFFIVSALTTFFGLIGLYLVRKKYPAEVLRENHEVAAIIFNAFGLFYGVMLAFVVFVTWSGYDDATKNLQLECSEALDLFHSSAQFPEPLNKNLQQGLRDYVTAVYNDEIPKLAEGKISLESGGAHNTLAPLFYQMDTQSMANRELYAESLRCLNRLAEYRRLRIFAGNDTVPAAVWLVLLVGSLFTVSYTYFFGMKNIRAQYLITASLTATVALILFLIYVLDHPFTGANRISLEPLREALEVMQKT